MVMSSGRTEDIPQTGVGIELKPAHAVDLARFMPASREAPGSLG
jgi:hypothetical protein